jgi:olefin beta-lactone synthetase
VINFYTYIHHTLTQHANKVLIVWPGNSKTKSEQFTGKDLHTTISNYRQLLFNKNIKAGNAVLLALPVSMKAINGLLAIQSIGAIPVLPPAKPGLQTLLRILKQLKIKAVVVDSKPPLFVSLLLEILSVKLVQLTNEAHETFDWKPIMVPADQPALISHTSGSTGNAKAIYRNHRVLSAQHIALKNAFPPFDGQRDFPLFPNIILHNLSAGVTSVLPEIPAFQLNHLNAAVIIDQIKAERVNTLTGNVFYFRNVLEQLRKQPAEFPLVKAVGIGGSPVSEKLAHALSKFFSTASIYIIYGSSEAEPISIRKIDDELADPVNGYFVGIPSEDLEVRIQTTTQVQTKDGLVAVGEIEVKGAHVANRSEDEWLATGDIGYLKNDHKLFLTARKINGGTYKNIQHYQVEHVLQHYLQIENAAAVSSTNGFVVFVQGNVLKEIIWEILNTYLPAGIVKDVQITTAIPVDNRHRSKILYDKLK